MQRFGEQQFGITNNFKNREQDHKRYGWFLIEVSGPHSRKEVWETEKHLKKCLRQEIGVVPEKQKTGTPQIWRFIHSLNSKRGVV